MRLPAVLGLLGLLVTGTFAAAQVRVSAQTSRSDFLLYERVDLLVTIENASESDVVLSNGDGHPWLSFVVSKQNHLPVHAERQAQFKPINLKVGESKTLRVNLTPLFSFREEGNYSAEAVIDLPGAGEILSEDVPFTVLHGRKVWTEQRPVAGSERTYSLLRFSPTLNTTELYLRVEDPADNVVYANIGLGQIEAYVDPQVFFDPQGNIHVLQLISMSTYLYTRADPQGKILHQGVFKAFQQIPPRLEKMEDGNVAVNGGIEERPEMVRESLAAGQGGTAGHPNAGAEMKKPVLSSTDGGASSVAAPGPDAPVSSEPLESPGAVSEPSAAEGSSPAR